MKIAFIGSLPAAAVLPAEYIREKHRGGHHPAPWIAALLPALAKASGFRLRVILIQRAILRHCIVELDGVEYEGIPYHLPERLGFKTLHLAKSIQARRALKSFQPDLVHAFGMETGSATIALRSGFPVSCFIQGMWEFLAPYFSGCPWGDIAAARWSESRAVRQINWFVAENEFARGWALERNPAAKVVIIPHPLRQDFLDKAAPTYHKQIISVGGLNGHKGMDTVIRAFSHVQRSDCRLCIVGSGPLEMSLRRLVDSLGLDNQVEFAGTLDTDNVIERMNASTALAIGSRMDTSPNVISEAHAIGLPVVGTRAGGIPEMIDEGIDGHVVEVDDDVAMGRWLEQLLAAPENCRKLGESGREKVRLLNSPTAAAQAHVEFFHGIQEDIRRCNYNNKQKHSFNNR